MKMKFISLLIATLAFSGSLFAEEKQARSNDIASKYILERDGDFFRIVNGQKCQITTKVEDFKVSQHPRDVAMVYFIKRDRDAQADLWVLRNASTTGHCPKADTRKIMDSVKKLNGKFKYSVVSNTHTNIVNVALDTSGRFAAWENNDVVLSTDRLFEDYRMNNNYGAEGKPFSSYAVFLITPYGRIYKVKGRSHVPSETSNWDSRIWSSLQEFMEKNL